MSQLSTRHACATLRVVRDPSGYAAAGDHMLLMAHALGLAGVWLSKTGKSAKAFKEQWGLPDIVEIAMHIWVGWPAMGSIKSARVPLEYMMILKDG